LLAGEVRVRFAETLAAGAQRSSLSNNSFSEPRVSQLMEEPCPRGSHSFSGCRGSARRNATASRLADAQANSGDRMLEHSRKQVGMQPEKACAQGNLETACAFFGQDIQLPAMATDHRPRLGCTAGERGYAAAAVRQQRIRKQKRTLTFQPVMSGRTADSPVRIRRNRKPAPIRQTYLLRRIRNCRWTLLVFNRNQGCDCRCKSRRHGSAQPSHSLRPRASA